MRFGGAELSATPFHMFAESVKTLEKVQEANALLLISLQMWNE